MDSYQNFVEIFKQAISTRNFVELTNILENGRGFLGIVSIEHRESVVCSILDSSDGLLWFLDYELAKRQQRTNRDSDNAFTEGFRFLEFFINNFYTTSCFVQYIQQIKDVCQLALIIRCSHYTQKAACNAFIKLIELFEDHDLKLMETVEKFVGKFPTHNIKERKLIFCVLGKIVKHNGGICPSQKHLNIIFRLLYSDACQEYNPDTNISNDFYMYFNVLADMLDSTKPPNEIRERLFRDVYKWIKEINSNQSNKQSNEQSNKQSNKQQHRVVMRSATDLLNRHMNLFRDLLYPDCKYWHDVLWRLSRETTSSACGQRALKTFYRIIGQILTDQNNEESRNILLYFLEEFQREFKNTGLDLSTLQLIVYGFSQMAAPCKKHMDQFNIRHMYSIITSYALPLCFNEQSHSAHIGNVCCYQEALSEMLCHMTDVTIEKINVLVRLSNYTIKRFPELAKSNNALAISTLIKTISNLGTINKTLLQRYLDNIIYDGIAWSCSHTLALDAELQRELDNSQQMPICYKNYLLLWTELLNAKKYYNGRELMVQYVADTLIDVCVTLIGRLDIRVKRINEDTVLSDVALTQSAMNQADFRVFANLVDLYVDVIDASQLSLFVKTVHRFLQEIVRLSYKYPLISGFYKLVRAGMKIFVACTLEEEEKSGDSRRMEELLSNYLAHTLDLIPAFSNELLIACLYLILNAPLAYVEDTLPRTLPAFKIAFIIGLNNLELAYTALTALETWTTMTMTTQIQKRERNEQTNYLLREVVAYLEPYLRSTESSVEISQDLTTTMARKRVKRVDVIDTECTLRNFQRRVLLFFGSLGHDLLSYFVHERASRSIGASWDHKNLLKYNLPLPDARLDIHFDRTLPRIIALARDSSDRRTKIAACEVLHSMVALVVGSTARHLSDPENRFTTLYNVLCPAVLALGCDSDEVVCGLFQPLMLQLMHWLSSRFMLMSPVIPYVLDSLFDGLTDDSNPALREFSGMCLAEFTRWSIRQASDIRETPNVHLIVRRINNLALHPSTRKRVAAAVAFNHLYAILREDDDTVSIYWLEIFYCFVRSLDGCDDPSIANALIHIEKVIKFKASLLLADSRKRRKPHEFESATLIHALYWLLSQCGALDERCRAKCMELYNNVSHYVGSYVRDITRTFVETYGMDRLNDIVLRGLESGVEDISVAGNMTPLLKALDCSIWFIERQLLPIEALFPANNTQEHVIFSCIRNFAHQFWRLIAEPSTGTAATAMKSRELEQLQILRCKTLMTILNFVQVLLNVDINLLPESLWDESLSALTIKCIMHPRAVGFDVKNIEMTNRLPSILETLLNSMRSKSTYDLPDIFKKDLLSSIQECVPKFFNLRDVAQNDFCDNLIQHINGLILLERCGVLDRTILEMSACANSEDTIVQIFKFLVNERIGELICSDLSVRMIEYLRALMEFQLSQLSLTIETPVKIIPDDTRSMIETLVRLMSDDTPVIGTDSAMIAYGEYFLNTFRSVIFKYMFAHMGAITLVFDDLSRDNPSFLLKWIEDLLLFMKRHRRELQAHVDGTVNAILRQFMCLKSAMSNIDSRKERLMNIYSTAVRLKSKPAEIAQSHVSRELYQWILDQLTGNNGLEYKVQILQNFLICLTDVTDRGGYEKLELRAILRTLKTDGRSLCSNLSETSVSAMKVIDCFETLLVLLSTTRSIVTLECVIHFAVGTGDRLFDEKLEEHLRRYYHGASDENVLRSLEVTYRAFMNVNTIETERLDVLHGFLLPTFKFCDVVAIEHFFEQNIRELHAIAQLCLADGDDVKQTIVSKIGCFQLIAIMFASIDMDKIIGVNGTITRNALDRIETGKELFQSLFNSAKNTRCLRITRPECGEFARLLHCAAYNCSLAIVSLKEEERFYSAAFGEDRARGLLIWEKIIDCGKCYKLGQIFEEHPKTRETTVNIRSAVNRGDQRTHRYTYVHSYDLSTSTLNEDINAYDLNRCVLLPSNFGRHISAGDPVDSDRFRSHGATSVALESDDFNKHECMPYICVLLRRIKEVSRSSGEPPKWLQLFLNAILTYNHPNIRLFMLKIVSNTADVVFKSYAKSVLSPIVKATGNYLERHDLNYIITDILEILMGWHDVAVPSDEGDRAEAQRLFEVLVDKVLIERSDSDRAVSNEVYNYNLSLLKTMVEKWHGCLRVPSILLNRKMESAPNAAVYFILVLLDNNMTEEIVMRDDIVDFLLRPLGADWNASETEKTPLQCCECLGLYLKSLDNSERDETKRTAKKCELKKKIFAVLGPPRSYQYMIKQIKRIAVLCRTYPEVAADYINVAISAMAKNLEKSYCLEILALSMPRLSAENIVDNLRRMERVLANRVPSCEKMTLQIVRDAVAVVSSARLLPYVNLAILYVKDNTTEHRELVYDILMRIYKKYSADIAAEDDASARILLSISVRNLLAGMLDPSHDLQDRILRFWTEETILGTEKSKDRLIALLTIHSSWTTTTTTTARTSDDAFAPFVALLMLQLATRSIDYTKKMFDAPLHNSCTFEDYRIAVSWRRRNLSCMTPMFVDSLASQMSYSIFSQSVDNDSRGNYLATPSYSRLGIPLRLRATQDLHFEPTIFDDEADVTAMLVSSHDVEFDRTTMASSSKQRSQITTTHDKRFRRFLAKSSDVANIYRHRRIQKNVQRVEMMKQENVRQRSSVRLYRNYRIGDFPDIEISHSSLIVPLQQLIKLDQLICRDVTVCLLCSLIKETIDREKSDDFYRVVVENLKRILHDSSERDSRESFNAIILETLLQLSVVDCNPRDIVKVSKANSLSTLGALLLERSLLPDARNDDSSPTSSKKMRRDDDDLNNEETDKWAQLASLYKSLNDVDVVLSIFRERQSFGDDLQEAVLAEANGDWIRARDAFRKAYELTENSSIKEHCLQGLFEAANNLCDWSAIDRFVKSRTNNGNLNNIWHDTWKDWMIPYVCDAYVHMLAEGNWKSRDDDVAVIESWMCDRDKLKYLKPAVGEDLVMFLLKGEAQRQATDLLKDLLDKAGEQWVGLSPLCTELGICELLKLQAMNDLDASLKVLRCANEADYLGNMVVLLNFWSAKVPTIRDNLIQWNKLAAYRTYSSTLFESALHDMLLKDDDEDSCERKYEIRKRMRRIGYQLRLDIADAALNQKHRYIAEKHLNYMNGLKKYVRRLRLELPLMWLETRTKYLCAEVETDTCRKMSDYTASWEFSHRLLNESGALDVDMSTAVRQHIGAMASRIEFLSKENEEFASALVNNPAILQDIGIAETTSVDLDHLREQLLRYSLNNLRFCCEHTAPTAAANVGKQYCALARHCYGRLTTTDMDSDELFREFLFSTLRSMHHDYLEATHYFPCLLSPERLRDKETRETFVRECVKLRPWLFLRWRDLLFSHLGTPSIASAVLPIVERLAETYPDAVAYTYHLIVERNPGILQDGKIQRIRSLLRDKAEEYERFVQAIQYVVQPELYLKYHLDKATKDLSRGQATAIESLLRKVYPISSTQMMEEKNPRPGDIYKVIARYESEIKVLNPNNRDATYKGIQQLKKSLNDSLDERASKNRLKDYSPFLHEYTGSGIEIPGQYSGDKEPMPRYHARIARFEPYVAVMQSLRRPIRIGMVGNNGREYKFLVKFGEDLTIDHSLQQLYATMNRTLHNDPSCRQRRLAIDTYEVVPLSRSFGLIQWIEDTRSMKDLVQFTLSKRESDRCKSICNKYAKWMANVAPSKQRIADWYKEAVSKYNQRMVTEQMERLIGETRRTALRDAFVAISSSPECFVTLRRNFVASYATMCAAHWLAGVGDRHLENTLVRVATGRCLGIDFGHVFGSGIRASIPELVPFRLTPQILELLRPFTERDLLATIMTHTMRALRDDRGPILACMDIFIHKPANRLSINDDETTQNNGEDIDADLTWSSKRNIEIVAKKLNGIHPSFIMLEQLKEAHDDEYFTRYYAIVMGNDGSKQARTDKRNDCLTPAEQVDCLLDQAKDLNILGRMYENWQPWL